MTQPNYTVNVFSPTTGRLDYQQECQTFHELVVWGLNLPTPKTGIFFQIIRNAQDYNGAIVSAGLIHERLDRTLIDTGDLGYWLVRGHRLSL